MKSQKTQYQILVFRTVIIIGLLAGFSWLGPTAEAKMKPHRRAKQLKAKSNLFLDKSYYQYTPSELRQAYGVPSNQTGKGQSIWIIDAYDNPNLQSDLAEFSSLYNLPSAKVNVYYPEGKVNLDLCQKEDPTGSLCDDEAGWAGEAILDAEVVHGAAPDVTLNFVFAISDEDQAIAGAVEFAVAHGAAIVSMSFGEDESQVTPDERPFQTNIDFYCSAAGVTCIASTGDGAGEVPYPAVASHVLGVGGTHLVFDGNPKDYSESAWSETGGGFSAYAGAPPYQSGFRSLPDASIAAHRTLPDISADADPATGYCIFDSYTEDGANCPVGSRPADDDGLGIGGTSASTQLVAAFIAIANANQASGFSVGDIHSLLYTPNETLAATAPNGFRRDITQGAFDVSLADGAYPELSRLPIGLQQATIGYDLMTGLGVPQVANLITFLNNNPRPQNLNIQIEKDGKTLQLTWNNEGNLKNGFSVEYLTKSGWQALAQIAPSVYFHSTSSTSGTQVGGLAKGTYFRVRACSTITGPNNNYPTGAGCSDYSNNAQ